jgi:predicted CXXCH cytochrome family protein
MLNKMFIALIVTFSVVVLHAADAFSMSCYQCHEKNHFEGIFTHDPVQKGECIKCHNPHAAYIPGLLQLPEIDLCFSCHEEVKNALNLKFIHQPLADGNCTGCHDPHASDTKLLLKKKGADLCFGCHKENNQKYDRLHAPYAEGKCLVCHSSHASESQGLLTMSPEKLCGSCHHQGEIMAGHQGFPKQSKNCVSCHNPHGGKKKGLLRSTLHNPFSKGCSSCHREGQTKVEAKICLDCHDDVMAGARKLKSHLLIGGGYGCLICHTPHASDNQQLLKSSEYELCRSCHADTYTHLKESMTVHPEIEQCSNCHDVHGSDNVAMLADDGITVCSGCHKSHDKLAHPLGAAAKDRRNQQPVVCLTCHNPMGSSFKSQLRLSGRRDLCVQCHQNY